jgi:hypothetical protein
MTSYQSDLLRLLSERGYIHQLTDGPALDALAAKQVMPGYIGFDATAPSLHVGNLVSIMLLRRLQQRRDDADWRSNGQRRGPQDADRCCDRRQYCLDQDSFRAFPDLW